MLSVRSSGMGMKELPARPAFSAFSSLAAWRVSRYRSDSRCLCPPGVVSISGTRASRDGTSATSLNAKYPAPPMPSAAVPITRAFLDRRRTSFGFVFSACGEDASRLLACSDGSSAVRRKLFSPATSSRRHVSLRGVSSFRLKARNTYWNSNSDLHPLSGMTKIPHLRCNGAFRPSSKIERQCLMPHTPAGFRSFRLANGHDFRSFADLSGQSAKPSSRRRALRLSQTSCMRALVASKP